MGVVVVAVVPVELDNPLPAVDVEVDELVDPVFDPVVDPVVAPAVVDVVLAAATVVDFLPAPAPGPPFGAPLFTAVSVFGPPPFGAGELTFAEPPFGALPDFPCAAAGATLTAAIAAAAANSRNSLLMLGTLPLRPDLPIAVPQRWFA